MVGNEQL